MFRLHRSHTKQATKTEPQHSSPRVNHDISMRAAPHRRQVRHPPPRMLCEPLTNTTLRHATVAPRNAAGAVVVVQVSPKQALCCRSPVHLALAVPTSSQTPTTTQTRCRQQTLRGRAPYNHNFEAQRLVHHRLHAHTRTLPHHALTNNRSALQACQPCSEPLAAQRRGRGTGWGMSQHTATSTTRWGPHMQLPRRWWWLLLLLLPGTALSSTAH